MVTEAAKRQHPQQNQPTTLWNENNKNNNNNKPISNSVWIRWIDSTGAVLSDTVDELQDEAQIKDLRKAFVAQQALSVSPAAVEVRKTENGHMLEPNKRLAEYLVGPTTAAAVAKGPGKSYDTAIILTMPQPRWQHPGDLNGVCLMNDWRN